MDGKQKKKLFALLGIMVPLCIAAMVFLVMLVCSEISLLSDIGLFFIFLLLVYAIVELVLFHYVSTKSKAMGRKEERIRKSIAVFLAIFAFSVLVAEVYPPFTDNPVETVFLLLAFSYAVSEIVVYFLWSGDEKKEAYDQPVRLSVIMALFVLLLLVMLSILCLMRPEKVSPAVVADETRATTFITHPTRVIESATTEEREQKDDAPAAGTIIKEERPHEEPVEAFSIIEVEDDVHLALSAEPDVSVYSDESDEAFVPLPFEEKSVFEEDITEEVSLHIEEPPSGTASSFVPSVPIISTPFAITYESSSYVEEEDDFWADFYIEGESELYFEDGWYYFSLYVNGVYFGPIEAEIVSSRVYLSSDELSGYIKEFVTIDTYDNLFNTPQEYLGFAYLEEKGVSCEFKSAEYEVHLTFGSSAMPVQILSISGSNARTKTLPLSGAEKLDPATFVLKSRYSLSANSTIYPFEDFKDRLRFKFSSSNSGWIGNVGFNFNYSFDFTLSSFHFDFGSYLFYTDYPEKMLRFSWGNISADSLSLPGTLVGVRVDKSLSYSDSGTRKSIVEKTIGIEKESDVRIYNEEKEIFRRTLQPGSYRLQDFILYSGVNRIEIEITPLDGSPVIRYEMQVNYESSLLAPGEFYYGLSIATSRTRKAGTPSFSGYGFSIPIWKDEVLEYDFRNFLVSGYVDVGVMSNLSMNMTAAFQNQVGTDSWWNPSARLSFVFTHANALGTTRYNLSATERTDGGRFRVPTVFAKVGHQMSTGLRSLSSVYLGLSYNLSDSLEHDIDGSVSLSGRFGFLGWGLGLSAGYSWNSAIPWSISPSINFSPFRNARISASMRFSGSGVSTDPVSGRIYLSWSFKGGGVNSTLSDSSLAVSASAYDEKNSFYATFTGLPLWGMQNSSIWANYSHFGDFVDISASMNAYGFMDSDPMITLGLELSGSAVFADGLVGFASSIPSNFLLVKQEGVLAGNELSIGSPSLSSSVVLNQVFGVAMYDGFGKGSYFSLYSSDPSSFLGSVYNDYSVPDSSRGGYVVRMRAESLYSAAATVCLPDGKLWVNGSSPLYKIVDGDVSITDEYLFTDSSGMFVVSQLESGIYGFDVQYGGSWYLYIFEIIDNPDELDKVQLFFGAENADADLLESPYSGVMKYPVGSYATADEFWAMVYPDSFDVEDVI